MLPTNNSERKQKFRRFGVYYALSVTAICVIVFAFADGLTGGGATLLKTAPASGASEMVFSADSLLHHQLSALETIDNQISVAQASGKSRVGIRNADSLRRLLPKAEQDFQFSLDSVSRMSHNSSSPALKQTVDFFAGALALRAKRLGSPRNNAAILSSAAFPLPASGTPMLPADELIRMNPELKEVILKKDIRIADMEAMISQLKKNGPSKNGVADDAGLPATRQLQQDYETLQKNYKTLTETNTRLRNNANQAVSNTSATESGESDAVKTARVRTQKMEQQLQEMNADLSFSTVDCNLSRADVNQIIYNGKQRKILLQQALDILTALKKSSDEEVQKRAMQKIGQLNRIAMTVRD